MKITSMGLKISEQKNFSGQGQNNCAGKLLNSIKDGSNPPIPYDQIFEIQRKLIDSITK